MIRLLTSALARLLDRPDADLPGIPGHVAASWRRSVARGVDPATVANRHHPDLDLDSRLVRCARPVIEQLAEQIAGAPVCVVLTDDRARLLVRLDTTVAIGRAADDNQFAEGFGYDEGAVGTNQSAPRGALRPVDQAERDTIVVALRESEGNRAAAAAALGVARSTLYRKIAQYRITA